MSHKLSMEGFQINISARTDDEIHNKSIKKERKTHIDKEYITQFVEHEMNAMHEQGNRYMINRFNNESKKNT